MSGSAGSGGLGALGWSALVGGIAVAGLGVLYVSGVFGPQPIDPVPEREQAEVVSEPAANSNTQVEPVDPEQAVQAAPEAEDPETNAAAEVTVVRDATPEPVETTQEEAAAAPEETAVTEAEPEAEAASAVTAETAETDVAPEAATKPVEEEQAVLVEPDTQTTEEQAEVQPEDAADPEPAAEPAITLAAPSFDVVRVEPDGTTVIAGKGTAGSLVTLLVDAAEVDQFPVGSDGGFVTFQFLGTTEAPRVLTLRADLDGQSVLSTDSIILAPSPKPTPEPEAQVAEAPAAEDTQGAASPEAAPASEAVAEVAEQVEDVVEDVENNTVAEVVTAEVETAASNVTEAIEEHVASQSTAPAAVAKTDTAETLTEEATQVAEAVESAEVADQTTAEAPSSTPDVQEETAEEPAAAEVTEAPKEEQPAPVTVLRASEEGVEVVQSAASEQVQRGKIVLDTISYSDEGDVELAGRAQSAAVVRVYVNNNLITDFNAGDDGRWQGRLPHLDPGVYTLRLDELDGAGKVLSRLETPFKREAPEVLQPAPQPEESPGQPAPLVRAVTVQEGDTLWAISRDRYGSGVLYVRVFEANRDAIRDPDLIYPGQVFSIPD